MQQELEPRGIKIQIITPARSTPATTTMADSPFRWLDDVKHVTERWTSPQDLSTHPGEQIRTQCRNHVPVA
jgi:hypothetical protein